MLGLGAMEVLMLLGLGGNVSGDLVSVLPADIYFQSRRVPVNIENMEDLAKADPVDGKTQILQLLALRTLAEQPELHKKAKDSAAVLKTIERIARARSPRTGWAFRRNTPREPCSPWEARSTNPSRPSRAIRARRA